MDKNFTHLHVHSSYSLLDGYSSPAKLVARAKELGMTAMALTDHNHLLGIPQFKSACEDAGIKPILGYEAYYTPDMSILSKSTEDRLEWAKEQARKLGPENGFDFDAAYLDLEQPMGKKGQRLKKRKVAVKDLHNILKDYEYNTKSYHLILIAKNQTGWKNLVKIQSESAKYCTYNGRYHCDLNLLRKYHEGIICSTACVGSYFAQMIINGNYDKAIATIKDFHELFGDDFYLEIQPLNITKQHLTNFFLMKYAKEYNIKMIATNDIHYTMQSDHADHAVLVNMGMGRTINYTPKNTVSEDEDTDVYDSKNNMVYSNDYWVRSYDEMIHYFTIQYETMCSNDMFSTDENIMNHYMDTVREALENTNYITDQIEDIKLGSSIPLFPETKVPEGYTRTSYFEHLCLSGLFEYKKNHPDIDINKYFKRLYKEIRVIKKKGFVPYFLCVYNYVNYCKRNKIAVGPGRGSAAGSLCLYMLQITSNIDPIEYNLSFERFLTEDRSSPPDWIHNYLDYENTVEPSGNTGC